MEPGETFGWAVKQMHNGSRVSRAGWNGKGMWIALQVPDAQSKMTLPYIYMSTVTGDLVPWLASQTDILGDGLGRGFVNRLAALLLTLTLACAPPPSDEAATIQSAEIIQRSCGGWHQPLCPPYVPGNVRLIEDMDLTHGMNNTVFSMLNAGPPASYTSSYGLYSNPNVGVAWQYYWQGQWYAFGGGINVATNYGGTTGQVSNSRLCVGGIGCSPIVVTLPFVTFYRSDTVVPRNAYLVRRVWYRQCAFGGPWNQVLAVGPAVDVTTAPDGTFSAVSAAGVFANTSGWQAANCPGEYGAYEPYDYISRCDPGGQHRNEVCITWPFQGTCDVRLHCPPY